MGHYKQVATKLYLMEQQKKYEEKLQKVWKRIKTVSDKFQIFMKCTSISNMNLSKSR